LDKLTLKQRKSLDACPNEALARSMSNLLAWEKEEFGDFTISELITRFLEEIENRREGADKR